MSGLATLTLALLLAPLTAVHAAGAPAELPNALVTFADDQGNGDIAVHGNPLLETPQLDRLHAKSVRLTDFHVDPTRAPTRATLLAGGY